MERLNLERLALSTTLMVPGQCICQVFGQPKPLVLIQLEGLVVSLVFRFWGHSVAYESNHFLEQRRRMTMPSTLVSIGNKTTKVKRPRKGWFCVFFFGFCFVVSPFFYIFVKPTKFFIIKNLVITYKLSTIESFYHKKRFCYGLRFS